MSIMSDQIKSFVDNQNTIGYFNEIKNRMGGNGYDGVTLSWVSDTYIEVCNRLKPAFEVNIFDQLPISKQRFIYNTLQSIASITQTLASLTFPNPNTPNPHPRNLPAQFNNWQNQINQSVPHYTNLTNNVIQLQNAVDDCRIDERILGFKNHQDQLEKLATLLQEYNDTLAKTKAIKDIFDIATNQSNHIAEIVSKSDEQIKLIDDFVENGNAGIIKSNEALNEIEKKRDTVKDLNQEVENIKIPIVAFHKNIESYQKQMDKGINDLNQFTDLTTKNYKSTIKEFTDRTNNIVKSNEEYQKIIDVLLKGANAGKLNKTFDDKATEIDKYQMGWLAGSILCTLIIGFIALGVVIASVGQPNIALFIIERLSITIPFLFLDGFFLVQYNKRQTLINEYRFKSAIALSLWSFDELLKGNKEDDISKEFIISSIQRIYQSPFQVDDDFGKQQKELLGSLIKTVSSSADKVVNKVADKL